jgi:predicted dehydrogenase
VGVADIVEERARGLAARFGVPFEIDFRALIRHCDAAVVAVPTVSHCAVARDLLAAGRDLLVEKPIAATLEEADELIELAASRSLVLQIGHLEWFNTAMQVIRERIDTPRFVEGHRLGPFPDRATDIDVVRDLMVHDIDILQKLLGEEPERIESIGLPVLTSEVDIANARLSYPSGCVANLTASRVSPTPMRKIRFFQKDGYFSIDFLAQTAVVFRRERGRGGKSEIEMEELKVDRGDALLAQMRAFAHAVRTRSRPPVDAEGGLGALRTALRVRAAMPPFDDWG